jgi:hypothetical protein
MPAANTSPVSIAQRIFKLKVASTEGAPCRTSTGWDYAEQRGTKRPEPNADLAGTPHNALLRIIDVAGEDPEVQTLFGGVLDADQLGLGVKSELADSDIFSDT